MEKTINAVTKKKATVGEMLESLKDHIARLSLYQIKEYKDSTLKNISLSYDKDDVIITLVIDTKEE